MTISTVVVDGNGDAGGKCRVNTPELLFFSEDSAETSVCFRAVRVITRGGVPRTLGLDAADHETE